MVVLRRPGDGEQVARRPHRVGADAEGRLPALQGDARVRPALPERLRLPGAVDRGRGRAPAGPQLEARDRGVRPRGVRAPLPRGRRQVGRGADARLEAARPVDGLGQRLLHVQRHEHRVHLAVSPDRERARMALRRPPLDRVVPALRDVALPARADAVRRLPGEVRPVALRPLPAARQTTASRSSSGRRRRGRCPRTSPPPSTRRPSTACARAASGWPSRAIRTRASSGACPARSSSACATAGRSTTSGPARASSTASSRGTRSRSRRAPASSTSPRAAAARTSSSARRSACPC